MNLTYLTDMQRRQATGATTAESSYYGPLENLLNTVPGQPDSFASLDMKRFLPPFSSSLDQTMRLKGEKVPDTIVSDKALRTTDP